MTKNRMPVSPERQRWIFLPVAVAPGLSVGRRHEATPDRCCLTTAASMSCRRRRLAAVPWSERYSGLRRDGTAGQVERHGERALESGVARRRIESCYRGG